MCFIAFAVMSEVTGIAGDVSNDHGAFCALILLVFFGCIGMIFCCVSSLRRMLLFKKERGCTITVQSLLKIVKQYY